MVTICCLALAAALAAAAAGGATSRRTVVAAFYPLAFAAQQVGGDAVSVRNLTPAGAEPHDLELRPSDVGAVAHADLVLYLGRGFQPAVEKAVASTGAHGLDLLAGMSLRSASGAGDATADPHVWLDPVSYARIVARVGRALGRPRPAAALAARLQQLDERFRRGLASCRRRTFVTSHAAFAYLAARYRLTQLPLEGLSPEAEPSPKALAKLVGQVRAAGATTVFYETLVSPKVAQTVAREAHVRTAVLDPLEGLTPAAAARGQDYFTVMLANLAALRQALGCR